MAGGGAAINSVTFNPLKTIFTVNSSEYEDAGSITINCSGTPDSGVRIASVSSSDTSIAEAMEDALSRTTSGNNVTTNFSVRPKSAGTVTLTASAYDYVNLRNVTGTLEITVTAGDVEDESYLNKRGLTHFWENIDTLKQDKLTAGTNITISANNTISASQPTVGNATLTIQKNGTNVQTFTANATSNKTANITVPTKTSDLTNNSNFVADANYVHTDNNYTTTEKNKLAGIAAGAEVNVQANWAQTTTTADDYIKNKPTIPTVNNGQLTIQKNGTNVATFTANASSNATANITVPTAVTDLSDASNYVTQTDIADVIRTTDVGVIKGQNIADSEITSSKIDWTTQTYTVTLGQHIESYSEVTVKSFGGIAAIKGFLVTNAMVAQGEALFTINNCPDALKNQRIPTTGAAGIPYYYIDYDGKAFYDIGTVPVGNILFGVTFI